MLKEEEQLILSRDALNDAIKYLRLGLMNDCRDCLEESRRHFWTAYWPLHGKIKSGAEACIWRPGDPMNPPLPPLDENHEPVKEYDTSKYFSA